MTDLPVDDTKNNSSGVSAKNDAGVKGQEKKNEDQMSQGSLSGGKEKKEGAGRQEVTPITEYTRKVDLEPEVEGWLEKLEKEETSLGQPVIDPGDDGLGQQVVLDDMENEKERFKVVLPMTKDEVNKGIHSKVADSVRWLAEWCVRMMKMFRGKVAYRRE